MGSTLLALDRGSSRTSLVCVQFPRLFIAAVAALVVGNVLGCDRASSRNRRSLTPEQELASYRGTQRTLVVFAASESDPAYQAQQKLSAAAQPGFTERDLVVLPVLGNAAELDARFGLEAGRFAVVLVGKDGHAALKSTEPLAASAIFAAIDAMPMRQAEIRDRRKP